MDAPVPSPVIKCTALKRFTLELCTCQTSARVCADPGVKRSRSRPRTIENGSLASLSRRKWGFSPLQIRSSSYVFGIDGSSGFPRRNVPWPNRVLALHFISVVRISPENLTEESSAQPSRRSHSHPGELRSTTESTEMHGKANSDQRLPFRVRPCFPWLPLWDDPSCQSNTKSPQAGRADPRTIESAGCTERSVDVDELVEVHQGEAEVGQ